jgi:hypothetical protein
MKHYIIDLIFLRKIYLLTRLLGGSLLDEVLEEHEGDEATS